MTNIKKRIVSMILALCMVFTMVPMTPVSAASAKYYTVEKYDSDGNGIMLVNPTVSTNWSGRYGTSFITSLVGGSDKIRISNDAVTGFPDATQDDGWLDNGDLGDGSQWIIATDYNNECYYDSSYFYASDVEVVRFIYVPGGNLEKAGLTDSAGWADAEVKVDKSDLIQVMAGYDPANLGGNRLKAYNEAAAMVLNTTDATAESVAAAMTNLQNANDFATGIDISEESAELYVGQKQELTAVLDPLGSTDQLTWTSSDEGVVVVEDGVLKGISAGTATVTVSANDPEVKDSIEVTVNGLQGLFISNMGTGNVIAAETQELMLLADVEPSGIENLDWQWSVEDDTIAEVTPMEGNEYMASVKGKKEGTTNVIVSLGSMTSSFEVEVTPYDGPYVYFEYADGRDPQLLDENDTITLTCLDEGKFVVGRANGTTTWSGGNGNVTSIQGGDDLQYWVFVNKESGKWSPWDVRTLDMSVDSGGWSKAFTVNCVSSGITELKNYVNGTEVTVDDPYVTEGKISGVGVTTKGKNAEGEWVTIPTQALHYSTSDTTYNFRWVGNQMSITSGGQATMSVFMKDDWNVKAQFIAKCTYVPLTGFTIETPETFTITGEKDFMTGYYYGLGLYTDNLKITYEPSNATNTELIWEALTPDVAFFTTQHNSGIVPLKCGTAKFLVTSKDNSSLTQEVTVKFLYLYPLESAELAQTEYEMEVGDTQALEITTTPSNATEKGFSYSYDKEGIVEVKDGTIIAKSAGEVTVTGTPLDDTMGCNTLTFTVKVTGEAVEQDDPTAIVADGIAHGLSYLENRSVSEYGDEWTIFTVLRAGGSISDENKAAYLDSVEAKLTTDASENKLQPTDYARIVLTLGVMGEDPEDFCGFNLVEKLYTWKDLDWMTSNQISWTLLALDSRDYDIPEDAVNSRNQLIEWLLLFQMDDGGFALTDTSDVDMTGMIMQALAPYNNDEHPEVQAAFTKALAWLQTQITTEAGFAENASYNENSCTTAQVLTALAVAGIDPLDPANGLTVGKKNVITNLYGYKADAGFYWDPTVETQGNAMATQQVTYALEAYRRFAANENSLYDLTDVNPKAPAVDTIVADGIAHGLSYLENSSVNAYGNEWNIFTILRAGGSISEENKAAYLDSAEAKLTADATENRLSPSDYVRMVLTLGVMGEDPEDFRGFNLVEKLYTWKNLNNQLPTQISWTLLALDSRDYDIPEGAVNSRDQLIEWLLQHQVEDGGFPLFGSYSDMDTTGMIMQALAPYNNDDYPEVQAAFAKALAWLQTQITDNAGFEGYSGENSCTGAQVLTALALAGIDPLNSDNGLTVGKKNVVTNLYGYKANEGFYWDPTVETQGNAMATQQVTYALEAYRRFAAGENTLYDLTDVNPKAAGTITVAVERFSIGQGYLIEPYTVKFYDGETYADIFVRILEEHNFNYTTKGSSFYLSGIDGADAGTISVPDCIALLGQKKIGIKYVDPPTNDAVNEYAGDTMWLGEFSYSRMSGWMYSVGNDDGWEFPGVGMDGRTPKDGDVYRLQFTLWGYGEDLTGVKYGDESTVYYEVGDKTDLTREIALINQDKESWFAGAEGRESAYNHAMEVLKKLDATQAELDAALDLLKNPVKELKILTQPEDFSGEVGTTAVFKVEADGTGLTYQWQYSNANSGKWSNSSMTGNNTSEISVPVINYRDGQKYRCVITDAAGNTVTSDAAVLTVAVPEPSVQITVQPENFVGSVGENAVFTIEATGEGLSYQWQYSNVSSDKWANSSMTGANTASLTVKITNARIGQKYRCVVTDAAGNKVTSDVAVIQVAVPVITVQPEDYTGAVKETAVFTINAEGSGLTYQWQYSNAGSDKWSNSSMTGSNTNEISVPVINYRDGQKYRCVVTNAEGMTVISETAVLHVAK